MISLRPMLDSEYPAYLDYFIPDYAIEISANYGFSDADALVQARREIAQDLPQGVKTPGNVLLCVINETDSSLIGYLWYRPDLAGHSVFISDLHILASQQGQGFAKQALNALETELSAKGFKQIKLRVAENNRRAKHVYDVAGFRVTGINMSKLIKPCGP
ncbi:N-acetyltransferase [Ensifer sp. ENS12]|uniref:GNAT family N-acetyltransferase n=1 Tax=Ensifer sp. ENS12 TaxID=2854774 RepID=UPI000DE57F78|nr:GNAT family N-acetyltransferase [Ensifer sp. ENS12]